MEQTIMSEIVTAMTAYICDKLCRHPQEITDTEELDRRCGGCMMIDYISNVLNAYNALELLRKLEKDKIPRWILVSERLPEDDGAYICSYSVLHWGEHKMMCRELSHEDGEWYFDEECRDNIDEVEGHVIAWMPLPEPYREES